MRALVAGDGERQQPLGFLGFIERLRPRRRVPSCADPGNGIDKQALPSSWRMRAHGKQRNTARYRKPSDHRQGGSDRGRTMALSGEGKLGERFRKLNKCGFRIVSRGCLWYRGKLHAV